MNKHEETYDELLKDITSIIDHGITFVTNETIASNILHILIRDWNLKIDQMNKNRRYK